MRRTILAIAALSILAGCAVIVVPDGGDGNVQFKSGFGGNAVQGNGQNQVERREIATLDSVDINGPLQVELRAGQATSLQVEGDSNLLRLLRTDAAGGTLRVWIDGSIRTSNPLRLVYTTPQLHRIQSNGSGNMVVSGLNGEPLSVAMNGSRSVQLAGRVSRLDVRLNGSGSLSASGLDSGATQASLNGSGRLDLGRLHGDSLNLEVHGSGGVNASGDVRTLNVRLHGSGSADLATLSSQNAELVSNGSGSISAAVSQSLVADANGSGRVTVYGNPAQRAITGKRVTVLQ
ncbi:GIN domain-containing protein [Duganella callida]|uniref:DUF2807 domain-containing protein n=1 Tax=Duganella callida TaxID=2561932 RepID=A0A4Y9SNB5_9BURK|nr:DUF2807 domain-containing protein [Duganella callida]TFW24354.1 DUF2807 domain-containing protein [Duganella callida]